MKLSTILFRSLVIASLACHSIAAFASVEESDNTFPSNSYEEEEADEEERGLRRGRLERNLSLKVVNLSFQQPFSPFFVMVHNDKAIPLFKYGMEPTPELARLAEDGDAGPLIDFYTENDRGVLSVGVHNMGAPYFGGNETYIDVTVTRRYPYVTIASMAINTNDCLVAINGMRLEEGMTVESPGIDAGSEANNELCSSIPGPACADFDTNNEESGMGEGYVHVHRGFFGVGGDLSEAGYDWRNPMMQVYVY